MEEINISRIGFNGDKARLILPDGYEFEAEGNEFFVIKKKPKYPTTYEECWKVRFEVDGETTLKEFHNVSGYYSKSLGALQKLLCCRDAYWKIAGDEMGLGKSWDPDWNDYENIKYIIGGYEGEIGYDQNHHLHRILAFPTEEMRDAFYKNFKDLIEQCKELL